MDRSQTAWKRFRLLPLICIFTVSRFVRVNKEVLADSREAKIHLKSQCTQEKTGEESPASSDQSTCSGPRYGEPHNQWQRGKKVLGQAPIVRAKLSHSKGCESSTRVWILTWSSRHSRNFDTVQGYLHILYQWFDHLSSETSPFCVCSSKRPAAMSSLLSRMGGKKQKMSTLEKSKMDWDAFKYEEGITEELAIHNRGRDG